MKRAGLRTTRTPSSAAAAILIISLLTICSCASRDGVSSRVGSGSPTPKSELPPITIQRTGGFAGVKDTVVIDPHGGWTSANRGGTSAGGRLAADQITAIKTLAADPRLTEEAERTPAPTRCSDAFNYELTVGTTHVSYVDCPADPDQPTASMALVSKALQYTLLNHG